MTADVATTRDDVLGHFHFGFPGPAQVPQGNGKGTKPARATAGGSSIQKKNDLYRARVPILLETDLPGFDNLQAHGPS